jgi:hypothetical protein
LLLSPQLLLIALILLATSLIGIAPLLFRLTLLIKTTAVFLGFVSSLQFRVTTLFVGLPPLLILVLSLLITRLTLLLKALLVLALTFSLALLILALAALLILRLSFVVPPLLFSLPALLIVLATAATTFGLRRLRLLLFLLLPFFFALHASVFPVLRLLRVRESARAC